MLVEIKWSKTLQYRERELLLPLIPSRHKELCAVLWIRQMLSMRKKLHLDDPLFGYEVKWPIDSSYM